ncbi:MAG: cyclic nucleotide-binding domain-containing protein [Gammaproteobacteria bacterium]|nr:cyclic nucleotide-binding domain-containing protein [Gammaproteobacteria bacterium]
MGTSDNIVRLHQRVSCDECSLNRFCLAAGLDAQDTERLSATMRHSRPLPRGHRLFRSGEPLEHLYVIKAGAVKIYSSTADGLEQILRFHLPGDLMGLDAMGEERHMSTAVALETTMVCMLPWHAIDTAMRQIPGLQHQLLRFVGNEIATENERVVLLGQRSARERLAAFLLYLSAQFKRRGLSATEFNLPMSRQEIANYLALAIETVSRLFTSFQGEGLVTIERRFVRLESLEAMRQTAYSDSVSAVS